MREPEPARPRSERRERAIVAAACVAVALLGAARLDQPFLDGHLGYAGALRGVIGRNATRQDLLATRFAPLQNAGPTEGLAPEPRFNHPPLGGLLVGASFAVLGPSPRAARLAPIAASVLTLPFLFALLRRLWGRGVAATGLALWCLSPFVGIYAAMPSYEPLVLLAWVALLWSWARFHDGRGPSLATAAAATVLGLWTDWSMVALVSGLAATELVALLGPRRPRRPAFLLVLLAALVLGLGALAVYYVELLGLEPGRLESLYRFRSSVGSWAAADVAAHIAERTVALLTPPVVVAGGCGLLWSLAGRPGRPLPAAPAARAFLLVGLLGPPLALLVGLPQHAVIHCFSATFLLPGAVALAAVALEGLRALIARRARPWVGAAATAGALAAVAIAALPVTADGWVSDGSPFEGRPRLAYAHLVVAGWAQASTPSSALVLVEPATGVTGVRAWFHLDRRVRLLGRGERPEEALGRGGVDLALLDRARLGPARSRALLERSGGALVDRVLAVAPGPRPGAIEVLELVEEEPPPLWPFWGSAAIPPHRLEPSPWRAAVYAAQLRRGRATPATPPGPDASAAELAAHHLLAPTAEARRRAEGALLDRAPLHVGEPLCPGLEVVGVDLRPGPAGATRATVLLRALAATASPPRLSASLRGDEALPLALLMEDAFAWPEGGYLVATARLDRLLAPGRYSLVVNACGRTVESPETALAPRTLLPSLPRLGRL